MTMSERMSVEFFRRDAVSVAADLLGVRLILDGVGGIIVETEAYRRDDEASHSYRGMTKANSAMFSGPARAYIYRSYGLHWCLNFVCEEGSAVLIRALQPTDAIEVMAQRRGISHLKRLCAGPGNLCQALSVTGTMNEWPLLAQPFSLQMPAQMPVIVNGPRIGITKAVDQPWRFAVAGSPYLSKPVRQAVPPPIL
jgi:DNA-3-methyladenine glycosylase